MKKMWLDQQGLKGKMCKKLEHNWKKRKEKEKNK